MFSVASLLSLTSVCALNQHNLSNFDNFSTELGKLCSGCLYPHLTNYPRLLQLVTAEGKQSSTNVRRAKKSKNVCGLYFPAGIKKQGVEKHLHSF